MPRRDGTGPVNQGFNYGKRFFRNGYGRRGGCGGYGGYGGYGYGIGCFNGNKTRKEFLLEQKEILKKRIADIEAELYDFD